MKTIMIKKSNELSPNSKVIIHFENNEILLKGFESFSIIVEQGQEFFASQLWTESNRIKYEDLVDSCSYIIRPRLGKALAFISLMIFAACTVLFIFTKFIFSYFPLVLIAVYVLLYLTVLRKKYLLIEPIRD